MGSYNEDENLLGDDVELSVDPCHDVAANFTQLANVINANNDFISIEVNTGYLAVKTKYVPETTSKPLAQEGGDVAVLFSRLHRILYPFEAASGSVLNIERAIIFDHIGRMVYSDVGLSNLDLLNVSVDEAFNAVFEDIEDVAAILGKELKFPGVTGPVEEAADSGP